MTQEISALMDGEVEQADLDGIIKACHQNEQHGNAWRCYHVIGEALRSDAQHVPGLENKILSQLRSEPTVLAPQRRARTPAFPRIALAAAASIATLSAVAWLALQQAPAPQVVSVAPTVGSQLVQVDRDVDFVQAHREFTAAPDALIPASFGAAGSGDSSR